MTDKDPKNGMVSGSLLYAETDEEIFPESIFIVTDSRKGIKHLI